MCASPGSFTHAECYLPMRGLTHTLQSTPALTSIDARHFLPLSQLVRHPLSTLKSELASSQLSLQAMNYTRGTSQTEIGTAIWAESRARNMTEFCAPILKVCTSCRATAICDGRFTNTILDRSSHPMRDALKVNFTFAGREGCASFAATQDESIAARG